MLVQALFSLLLLPLASATVQATRQQNACNNSPSLCSKSYGEITHLGAHDSPFLKDASTGFTSSGNQFFNSTVQLDAGVRLLSAQVHNEEGEWRLCHSSCSLLDMGVLSDWLSEIKTWMDKNPNDVVTILLVNSDGATADDLHQQYATSQLNTLSYTPPSQTLPPEEWPTLQELITANTRVLTFVASLATETNTVAPYLMDEFIFVFENSFEVTALNAFGCEPDRPSAVIGNVEGALSANMLPLMNHFLYKEQAFGIMTPAIDNITVTNSPKAVTGSLKSALEDCNRQYSRRPAFVLVDFFDQGPAIEAVDAINGVTAPVGRKAVPNTNSQALQSSGASPSLGGSNIFKGLFDLTNSVKGGMVPTLGNWIWVGGDWGPLLGGGFEF
ncbi:hypothetical protein FQN54_006537 [Arachnomyces sp. PD_36]|nr:hypothetical protein FQN54_006537 [Arachnomyces sp. PD_36]